MLIAVQIVVSLLVFMLHAKEHNKVKVVYIGLARSGSTSLSAALERLGFSPCHGKDIMENALTTHYDLAQSFLNGDIAKSLEITEQMGYDAVLEFHGYFWKEAARLRPNAKFIVVFREYEKWEQSMQFLLEMIQPLSRYPLNLVPSFRRRIDMVTGLLAKQAEITQDEYRNNHFRQYSSSESVGLRRKAYDKFVREAKKFSANNREKTLIFNNKDGYSALCEFFEIDECPREQYPWLNSQDERQRTIKVIWRLEIISYVVALFIVIVCCYLCSKQNKQKVN